jgi:GDP-4-dehydro-6-deoxy-D-mannose reductase
VRVLITGASGFAGGYLARACAQAGEDVVGISRTGALPDGVGQARAVDLTAADLVREVVDDVSPEVIYHVAALSSVGRSWEEPGRTMDENVGSAVNLLEAIRGAAPAARVVWVSSCEVYGAPAELPVPEDAPHHPANPYAVSKSAAEMLAEVYADAYGLDIVIARPFSHSGPGQRPIFIFSALAHQAARARLEGADRVTIVTGNPETRRDFTDVRDVVRAYRALARLDGRGVYNVSSGQSVSAADHVRLLAEVLAPIVVEHEVDPARVRAHEVMDLRGDNRRLRDATGWEPQIPLRQTMLDTIAYWERQLSREPSRGAA